MSPRYARGTRGEATLNKNPSAGGAGGPEPASAPGEAGAAREGGADPSNGLASGVRALESLRVRDALQLGEEARDLARLLKGRVPIANGYLVRLGDPNEERLRTLIAEVLASGSAVRLRPLFPTVGAAVRFERRVGRVPDIASPEEAESVLREVTDALAAPELRAALGGTVVGLRVRVIECEAGSGGRAASADPLHGDPDELGVWSYATGAAVWRIDRRSGRVIHPGEGLDGALAERVADLADRAQLELGRPVEVEWCTSRGRVAIAAVRSLPIHPTFTSGTWRRVALVAADEGTVAPLAIDALDRGLADEEQRSSGQTVRRIYARPYRRLDGKGRLLGNVELLSVPFAGAAAARVTSEAMKPLAHATAFTRGLEARLAKLDGEALGALDSDALLAALEVRHAAVAEAFALLDRLRELTRAALAAAETACGPLPRECYPALAAPVRTKERKRIHDALSKLALRIEAEASALVPRSSLGTPTRRRWDELRASLANVRPLGIDVLPEAYGASDEHFLEALQGAKNARSTELEKARKDALRRVLATARTRSMGRAREAIVASIGVLVWRISVAKGETAEALAALLLRLRRASVEAGQRLVDLAVLEQPDDALYLGLGEIADALSGEPGAYAARVRLRREDDARWAWFDAPRRIGAQT